MKTKEEIASAWAGIKLEIFTDTKDLKYIHPYITPKQCLRAMEAYKEEAVTELKQAAVMPSLPDVNQLRKVAKGYATYTNEWGTFQNEDKYKAFIAGMEYIIRCISKGNEA